jgi:DNA-binding protein
MVERSIPLTSMDVILKKGGAGRVGEDSKQALKQVVEMLAMQYTKKAVKFAEHAGRKTVKAEDVKLAIQE